MDQRGVCGKDEFGFLEILLDQDALEVEEGEDGEVVDVVKGLFF